MNDADVETVRITELSRNQVKDSTYVHSNLDITLPKHDTDLNITLPGGQVILFQWRTQGPSLDICFFRPETIICWADEHMRPAPRDPGFKLKPNAKPGTPGSEHVRKAMQLCIPLSTDVLG